MSQQAVLSAPDISCSHCVATVQKAVSALPGVKSVTASEETKLVNVSFDPAKVDLDKISEVLDDVGYPVSKQ
jgi:copper ion binding protein